MMNNLIYALDQRSLDRIVPMTSCETYDCFDLIKFGDINTRVASMALCGVNSNYLSLMTFAAPLVPYGIVVRRIPGRSLDGCGLEFALYKQTKNERAVLSIGLSGSVLVDDFEGVSKFVEGPRAGTLGGGPLSYPDFPEVIANAGHRVINDELKYYLASGPLHHGVLGFMRDGVKKPGYLGAAHICLPYLVEVRYDVVPKYFDKNKEFIGWFKYSQLSSIVNMQMAVSDDPQLAENDLRFADLDLDAKIKGNVLVAIEPWSVKLISDFGLTNVIDEKLNPEFY